MSIGFNFNSPAVFPNESQLILWSFRVRHWFLLSSYESPRWHLLPILGCFFYLEKLLFCVAAFINYLSYIFWITCCSFYISTCCFILHIYVKEMASFLQPHEPTSASFKLFFCSFLTSLSLHKIEES